MPYIYKIVNKINNKIYIGKTLETIEKRWKEHCKDYKSSRKEKRPLYSAMNKYGIKNFYIEEVENCAADILSEREKYWIEYYDSFKNGYNATLGGDGKNYIDYELIYFLFLEGKNNKEISEIMKCDTSTVTKALDIKGITAEERKKRGLEKIQHPVLMMEKDSDKIIRIFASAAEAERFLNKPRGRRHIIEVCKNKRKSAYGYKWKYANLQ